MVVLFWCLISYQWSIWQEKSLAEGLIQWMMFLTCILITNTYTFENIIDICKKAAILVIIINVVYLFMSPTGSFSSAGMVGIYNHKNNFGLVISICIFFLLFTTNGKKQVIDLVLLFIAFLFLFLSLSKTSISLFVFSTMTVFVLAKLPNMSTKNNFNILMVIAWSILMTVFIILIVYRFEILDYLYYNMDEELLTGRGKLWLTMLLHAEDNLISGFGFNSVWGKQDFSEIYFTDLYLNSPIWVDNLVTADGGYIDLILSIGLVGTVVFISYLFHTLINIYKLHSKKEFKWLLALFIFIVIHNITETTFLTSTNILWFLMILISCISAKKVKANV